VRESQQRLWALVFARIFRWCVYAVIAVLVLAFMPEGMKRRVSNVWASVKKSFRERRVPFQDFLWDKRMDKALKEYEEFK
jgi:hypothetical protein